MARSVMDQKQLTKFKAVLESRAKELRHSIAETQSEGCIAQETHGRDEADRASRSTKRNYCSDVVLRCATCFVRLILL